MKFKIIENRNPIYGNSYHIKIMIGDIELSSTYKGGLVHYDTKKEAEEELEKIKKALKC